MALGAMTVTSGQPGAAPNAPRRLDRISFAGDGAYAAGGTAGFQALVRAALGQKVTVLRVNTCITESSGYILDYDRTNDKLKVFYCTNNGGAAGPLVEDTTANQSGRTYVVDVESY